MAKSDYRLDDNLDAIAYKVIQAHSELAYLDTNGISIAYQRSNVNKKRNGKVVFADTEKIKDKYGVFIPHDFLITFYADSNNISNEILEKLMYHELRHVGFSEGKTFIVPHDVEDFKDIINIWGIDWIGIKEEF